MARVRRAEMKRRSSHELSGLGRIPRRSTVSSATFRRPVNIAAISTGRFQSQFGRVRQDNPKGPPVSNP